MIKLKSAALDRSELKYRIGISSKELSDIESIEINAAKIISIENLTTFNTFNETGFLYIFRRLS
ncbi:hypothetical protein JHL18_05795 [Clostridium sp. YIM B02505]|uniref:Uncharacterized protein n=1 Tax=Clostridium yunnanense TaxID=2800325 RepID=A0ABS1ELB1_9CLOT|nr:hypothetical protein [Clostridium yunnanense]MBK1810158.1 hypothetical protein [Clostridium yunnanense]